MLVLNVPPDQVVKTDGPVTIYFVDEKHRIGLVADKRVKIWREKKDKMYKWQEAGDAS